MKPHQNPLGKVEQPVSGEVEQVADGQTLQINYLRDVKGRSERRTLTCCPHLKAPCSMFGPFNA
jgi:hypothetical protein